MMRSEERGPRFCGGILFRKRNDYENDDPTVEGEAPGKKTIGTLLIMEKENFRSQACEIRLLCTHAHPCTRDDLAGNSKSQHIHEKLNMQKTGM
jgi:hypothetical protein